MNRKTLIALGTFAALAIIALVVLRQPEKGERVGERPRPLPTLKAGDFDTLVVTKGAQTTVLKKEGDKYKVTSPVAAPADEAAAKTAFEDIEKLDFGDVVTAQKDKQSEFEVDDTNGVKVSVKKGDKVLADLIIGKPAAGGTMVRPVGRDEIWLVKGSLKFAFDKDTTAWRDKSITTFDQASAEQLEVATRTGDRIVLKQPEKKDGGAGGDEWQIVESSTKVDKLDQTIPSGIVSQLASWKANDFADKATAAETGLDAPRLTVTVTLKGGKKQTVLLGNRKGEEDVYVKTADAPQVFLVKKFNVERVDRRPIDFRDKTLCDIKDTELTEVAVTRGENSFTLVKSGSDWKATKPAKLELDTNRLTGLTNAFREWKGSSFTEDPSPKATGLAKPTATIVAKSKGKTCTLKIGDETKDKNAYYAQPAGSPDVLLAPKWSVDRILVKLDDIRKPVANK